MKLLSLLVLGLALVSASSSGAAADASLIAADPSWSPDGKSIAFDARVGDGQTEVYTASVDGGALRDLTADDARSNTLPSWSRRGSLIAYETDLSDPRS